ncbi:MAG: thioredoxin domain-containing protein [Anaerolineae bacterium]
MRHWEIGNEPNLSFFWSGTAAEYARYLQVADLVVHFVDPAATVVHGGIADTAGAVDWYRRFLAALAARAPGSGPARPDGGFFDAAAWHWYTYPRELAEGPASARSLLAERGLSKPIWVTEMGVPVWDDYPGPCWDPASPHRATQLEQSAYLWQAMTEAVASDVAVTIAFQAYDDCGNGPASYDAFGLVRNHASNQCWQPPGQPCWRLDPALAGTPRPAFDAYRVAARELAGASLLWRPAAADGWQRVLFYRPPGERVMVLWNTARETRTVEVFATGPGGTVLEAAGDGRIAARSVTPSGGKYTLRLLGATNRNTPGGGAPAMAGHPVFVVEHDAAAPFRSEIAPLPPVSPTTFDLVARAADGGTGVGAVQLWTATVDPAVGGAWTPLGDERPWPASPLSGEATFPFVGDPGVTYYFAASARDRAGNAAAAPAAAQAVTRIDGAGPTASATAPAPAATRTPTAPPTHTAVPSASPSPTLNPLPSETPTPIHVVARLYLPVAAGSTGRAPSCMPTGAIPDDRTTTNGCGAGAASGDRWVRGRVRRRAGDRRRRAGGRLVANAIARSVAGRRPGDVRRRRGCCRPAAGGAPQRHRARPDDGRHRRGRAAARIRERARDDHRVRRLPVPELPPVRAERPAGDQGPVDPVGLRAHRVPRLHRVRRRVPAGGGGGHCAGEQGHYWRFHDGLFELRRAGDKLDVAHLAGLAKAIGMDPTAFSSCMDAHRYRAVIEATTQSAKDQGFEGTPTYLINGRKV